MCATDNGGRSASKAQTQFRNTLSLLKATHASKMVKAVEQATAVGMISKPYPRVTLKDIGSIPRKDWMTLQGVGATTAGMLHRHVESFDVVTA